MEQGTATEHAGKIGQRGTGWSSHICASSCRPLTMVTPPSQPSKPEGWTSTSLLPSPCDMQSATKPCASHYFLGPDSHQPFPGLLKVLLLVGLPALAFLSLLTSHPSQSHSAVEWPHILHWLLQLRPEKGL